MQVAYQPVFRRPQERSGLPQVTRGQAQSGDVIKAWAGGSEDGRPLPSPLSGSGGEDQGAGQ